MLPSPSFTQPMRTYTLPPVVLALAVSLFFHSATKADSSSAKQEIDPILFFKKADVPTLQRKIRMPEYAANWEAILHEAQDYCDPKSPKYLDPVKYKDELANGKFTDVNYARQISGWMEILGFAYQMTGNNVFAQHGAALLEATARYLGPESKPMQNLLEGAYGDMMCGMAEGLDFLSSALTPEQRSIITDTARRYLVQHMNKYVVNRPAVALPHNFCGVCGGAIGMLAIALRDDYPAEIPKWIDAANTLCADWFKAGFDQQGSYFEGILYASYGLGNSLTFADALQRFQGHSPLIENPLLQKVPLFFAMQKLPGEDAYDARNDSLYTYNINFPYLPLIASGFEGVVKPNPLASWIYRHSPPQRLSVYYLNIIRDNRAAGEPPSKFASTPYGLYYKDQGLAVWRTGWEKEDVMFSIEAGPYHPVTHNQADKGHFNLYGLGYRWAADCGYGNNQEPKERAQTEAHSCVLVDGKGQALSGAALGTDGTILAEENTPRYGYALADSKSAYNQNNRGAVGVPLTKALRHVFFIRPSGKVPAYAVVLDDMEWGGSVHDWTWQMITWENMKIQEEGDTTFIVAPSSEGPAPKLKVLLAGAGPLALSDDVYTSDKHGGRPPNVYRRLHAVVKTANPRFVAVLAPLPVGAPEPKLTVENKSTGRLVRIDWGTRTDIIEWNGNQAKLLQ